MTIFDRDVAQWLVILSVVVTLPILQPWSAHAETPDYLWLDVEGEALPFQDHATILHVMRTATPVTREIGGMGAPDAERFVLDHRGTRFHVNFRTVDDSTRVPPSGDSRRSTIRYRDAAVFEAAAYELSELLGFGRVPPATERRMDDRPGTVQIFMEGILSEADLEKRGKLNPPDPERWNQQEQIMLLFDNLIANTGREPANLLVDGSWNVWFVDHARAFRQVSKLLYADEQRSCERRLWTALGEVGEEAIRQTLEPFLDDREIKELLRRRLKLIRHIEKLIGKYGEDAVIFELRPVNVER